MNTIQGPADYGPAWAKSSMPPVFITKTLLEHSHALHLYIAFGCFYAVTYGLQSLKYLLYDSV